MKTRLTVLVWLVIQIQVLAFDPAAWTFWSPREETTPDHVFNARAGRDGKGALVIETGEGGHWIGAWRQKTPVEGGRYYRFTAWRKHQNLETPRRSVVTRILWQDDNGKAVQWDKPAPAGYMKGAVPVAEPEYPRDHDAGPGEWGRFEDVLQAPPSATHALVELYLQWAPHARAEYADISLEPVSPPPSRVVKVVAVHMLPREGREPLEKPKLFAPLIEEAGRQKVDLVVLPETLTYYGTGKPMHECAEPVPGPSTQYFGGLAKKHHLHIVAGLLERDGRAVYNVAALIGPDGNLIGKYRKVTLPRGEITEGITPGNEYPVFDTSIGKVGMMICYDGFFPEVARALSVNGAEIIAWPVWGCNPKLASARACENHVYVVSSTYTDPKNDWMISGIYDHYGDVLAKATDWGTLAVAELNLGQPARWYSLGNFKAQIENHRPPTNLEVHPTSGAAHATLSRPLR